MGKYVAVYVDETICNRPELHGWEVWDLTNSLVAAVEGSMFDEEDDPSYLAHLFASSDMMLDLIKDLHKINQEMDRIEGGYYEASEFYYKIAQKVEALISSLPNVIKERIDQESK